MDVWMSMLSSNQSNWIKIHGIAIAIFYICSSKKKRTMLSIKNTQHSYSFQMASIQWTYAVGHRTNMPRPRRSWRSISSKTRWKWIVLKFRREIRSFCSQFVTFEEIDNNKSILLSFHSVWNFTSPPVWRVKHHSIDSDDLSSICNWSATKISFAQNFK